MLSISGTTGQPKGIQHSAKLCRYLLYSMSQRKVSASTQMSTTCFFHAAGFVSVLDLCMIRHTWIFNPGTDLNDQNSSQIFYREIDLFKPTVLIFGSHHCVLLANEGPKDKNLDLSSVLLILAMGSTVPLTLETDLKKSIPCLMGVCQGYAMTEILSLIALSFDVSVLGAVAPDSIVKIVNPENGKLCGPGEVGEVLVKGPGIMKGNFGFPFSYDSM